MSELLEFDPAIKEIEDEIIQFLVNSPIFMGYKPSFITIRAYFVTRKELTQQKLKKLTGFSSGTISQELKTFLDTGVITETKLPDSNQKKYTLESIEAAFMLSFIQVNDQILKYERELQLIQSDMRAKKETLKDLQGYYEVLRLVELFLDLMPFYRNLVKILYEEKAALEAVADYIETDL